MSIASYEDIIIKFNICTDWYVEKILEFQINESDFIASNSDYVSILEIMKTKLLSEEHAKQILLYVVEKLNKFSTTYDVNVRKNIDDYKLIYFIAYYFFREEPYTRQRPSSNIVLIILHQLMRKLLIAQEPSVILNKLDRFFRCHSYAKFEEEYGDIGYYHTIKSIYLMQKVSYQEMILEEKIVLEDAFMATYFEIQK